MFRFTNLIIFRMTRDCNLNCKYCFMLNKGDHKGELIEFNMLKKIINIIVEQRLINNRENEALQLVLHGGEVLLLGKKRLYEILDYITDTFNNNNLLYSLACQTNATLLNDEIMKILNKFNVNVGLSFDGVNDANLDRTDIKQEVFEHKFDALTRNNLKFGFIVVASKKNVDKLEETKEYLETLNLHTEMDDCGIIKGYKINYAEDMINPGPDSEIELTGQEIFEKVWKPELDRFIFRKKTIEYHTKEMLEKSLIDILSHHNNQTKSGCGTKWCGAGITMIAVEPDGEMDYCDRYSKSFPEAHMQHALDYDFLGIGQLQKVINYNIMKSNVYKKYECDTCCADYICDHGCEAFYRSKYGSYGIDTRIVCDQHKMFYNYILENLEKFLEVYVHNNQTIHTNDYIYRIKKQQINKFKITLKNNNEIIICESENE